jgi:hypothetical protein
MSELQAGYYPRSTEDILRGAQHTLQQFAQKPEAHPWTSRNADQLRLYYGGIGSVALTYGRQSVVEVCYASEAGVEVASTYKLRSGIWVEPMPLHEFGSVTVRLEEQGEDELTVYRPRLWPDGGFSLQGSDGKNLDPQNVWRIENAMHRLHQGNLESSAIHLSIVR